MSSREDEYAAQRKEGWGKPLCPRCGHGEVYPSHRKRGWWECANEDCPYYRRPFPSPSYGARGKPPWWNRFFKRN